MKILFTGAASFTGFWFVGRLAAAGAQVTAAIRGQPREAQGARAERLRQLAPWAEIVGDCGFGSERFLELIRAREFDVLCHHEGEARDDHGPDFDVAAALAADTRNISLTLRLFSERGGKAVVAAGSVFEPDEGSGPAPRHALALADLAQGLTWQVLKFWCETHALPLSKFVIADAFGPFDDLGFVAHAVARWAKGETLEVRAPHCVRDYIHVDLLSLLYAKFVAEVAAGGRARRFGPCGYMETRGAFAERLARELATRLGLDGPVAHAPRTHDGEPSARVNLDEIDPAAYGWSEAKAWDALAGYFRLRGFGVAKGAGVSAPATDAPAPARISGAVDDLNPSFVSGWLTSREDGQPRYLRVFVNDVDRGAVRADLWRPDLAERKISDGFSGFRFIFAGGLDPYRDNKVRLEDRDTRQSLAGGQREVARLVGGPGAAFGASPDFAVVNVGSATYEGGRIDLLLEAFGAPARFDKPLSRNATVESFKLEPIQRAYFEAIGTPHTRMRIVLTPRDPDAPVDIGFDGAEAVDPLLCANLIPGRLPDYLGEVKQENIERVSGPGEQLGRFAATGLATAFRLDGLVRRHFGRGLAECGPCLDWGAGAGRVAAPLQRIVAPGLRVTAADVDAFNVASGRARGGGVDFVEAPFLPPLPFADGAFGAVYAISVLTHLTEGAQFAWLMELRRLLRPGSPALLTVHSEYHMLREAASRPEILAETLARGISDSMPDLNLGPKLRQKNYYRSTFHTRAYVLENWTDGFEILRVYAAGNGGAQDLVVMRAV